MALSPARTIVIGDIHGCLDELQDLLRACAVDWSTDRVIAVGDLVAKGPDSRGVLQFARERGMQAVLGNHDAKVLACGPRTGGGGHGKHHAAVARTLDAADWRYLEGLPLYIEVPPLDLVVVHAGLVAGVPLDQQQRSLVINMRSITPAGEPSKQVDAGVPWASLWPGPAHVVFGHDAVRGLQQHPHATGLDTGCVYGRSLTALCLPERNLLSVPARRAYVEM
jgi:hypothetical protein